MNLTLKHNNFPNTVLAIKMLTVKPIGFYTSTKRSCLPKCCENNGKIHSCNVCSIAQCTIIIKQCLKLTFDGMLFILSIIIWIYTMITQFLFTLFQPLKISGRLHANQDKIIKLNANSTKTKRIPPPHKNA